MEGARLVVDSAFRIGSVDRRLFGTFVEHIGRCAYGGIYEPGHPSADDLGFRTDVQALVRELGPSVVRYPGGNFVSAYRWEDGVGAVAARPHRLDLAWRSIETNEVGLNEFVQWARRTGLEPMIVVNLGTRGLQEACDLLEYSNHPGSTYWSDLRRRHGIPKPHDIRLWCLGNEMDGPWQVGRKTAAEYGRLAAETARAMRLVDPTIELVAAGSSGASMPTFGAWERAVLEDAYEDVDYISLHAYYQEEDGDLGSFLASAVAMERQIESVVATADHVGACRQSSRKLKLAVDEWNVWDGSRYRGRTGSPWEYAPRLIEDEYRLADAVVVGDLLIALLRHADRVGIACMAALVNVIAPIRSEPAVDAWRQTTFYPFAITSEMAHGTVLRVETESPTYFTSKYGEVPLVAATAIHEQAAGDLVIFVVNREQSRDIELRAELRGFGDFEIADAWCMAGPDIGATNTAAGPDRVTPMPAHAELEGNCLVVVLPPVSWSALRLVARRPGDRAELRKEGRTPSV